MRSQSFTGYTGRVIGRCVLIAVISTFTVRAQPDVGCRQKDFGKFSEWSAALSMGPVVNSPNLDWHPGISPNGLSLYFGSNRPGGVPGADRQDIWVAHRASVDAPWEAPRNLGATINTEFRENSPRLSRDGHWLIFGSTRRTGKCVADSEVEFYISYRENAEDDFAWEPPVNFGCEINASDYVLHPTFFHDDDKGTTTMYFASSRSGAGVAGFDVFASTRLFHGAFGPPVLVPELSSRGIDISPSVRADGLEMFLKWNGAVTGSVTSGELAVATRESTSQPWSTPKSLGPMINIGPDNDMATLSCDGTTLYFVSNPGGYDLYVATRKRLEEPAPLLLSVSQDGSK